MVTILLPREDVRADLGLLEARRDMNTDLKERINPPERRPVDIRDLTAMTALMRSKVAIEDAATTAQNRRCPTELGNINVNQFLEGILVMINGDEHRSRRKKLNRLVRPEELIRWRDEVAMPSVDRWLLNAASKREDDTLECDLADVAERVFLEFAAKFIGLDGVDTEEGMGRLRSCTTTIFAGMQASHFEDREQVTNDALEAKRIFADEYFRPSFAARRAEMAQVESGEIADEEMPLNLMKLILEGLDPSFEDEDAAIREALLMFVATTGTSVQAILSTVYFLHGWFEQNPGGRHRAQDPDFLAMALQEAVRMRAPWAPYLTRLATEDIELDGYDVRAGDEIHARLVSANRDPAVFGPDAGEFNPLREVPEGVRRYGIGFGTGQHQCLGLRTVLGNDGKGGTHVFLLRRLYQGGMRMDPDTPCEVLPMQDMDPSQEIPIYATFPVVLDGWETER
jgi:cytochrome P450